MTLRVAPGGVRLTVPSRASGRQIDAFLRASQPWVDEQRARLAPGPPPLAHGDRLAHLDEMLELVVRPATGRRGAAREGSRLVVAARPHDEPGTIVEAWYRAEAARVIGPRARGAAEALGARAGRVVIRDTRSRWGSCSTRGTLSFSWRLMLAPERVLDYVIAHEACHLLRPDHSPAFWELVAATFPGHDAARAWLREKGPLLYRGPAWRTGAELSPA